MSNSDTRLPLIRKIGYGVGDAGANFCWTFIASFIMIYCTNTLGVSAAVIGTLMMVSKVLDGISDVIMGRIIDATHSKMGKARFWYLISSLPTAFFTFLLFNVPAGFSEKTKYIYIFVIYTLIGAVFYTMNNIAYSSLTALCTKNKKDRVQMGSYRFMFAIGALLFMSYTTSGLVSYFGGGQQGWRAVSIIYSIVCFVLLLVAFFSVKELPQEESEEKKTPKGEELGFFKGFGMLIRNKYFLMILVLYLVMYLSQGITSGMGIYFATYQMGDASLLGMISMAGYLPVVLSLPFIPQITARFGIRNTAIAGHTIGILGGMLVITGGFSANFPVILTGLVIIAVGKSPQTGALNAMIAETDEYSYLKTGKRLTGTIYSCSSVGIKIGTGIGTAVCGFLLDLSGFDGTAATQAASAISTINWSYLLPYALLPMISLLIFFFLKVETENERLRGGI